MYDLKQIRRKARERATRTGKAHAIYNLNRVGDPLYVIRDNKPELDGYVETIKPTKTINCAPSWVATMQILATVLMDGTPKGKRDAFNELVKIGQQLDAAKEGATQ